MFDWLKPRPRRTGASTDRRAGGRVPHVGKQPRARTKSGAWRRKRSDANMARGPRQKKGLLDFVSERFTDWQLGRDTKQARHG